MAKKMKLKLEDLKVESFVTELEKDDSKKVNGGAPPTGWCTIPVGLGCGTYKCSVATC